MSVWIWLNVNADSDKGWSRGARIGVVRVDGDDIGSRFVPSKARFSMMRSIEVSVCSTWGMG
jgi:hypothetical protein